MIRVLLAALLAAALVGVSLPAIAEADRTRAATRTHAAATDLAATLARFAGRNDPVGVGERGASRVLTVRIPPDGRLTVGGGPAGLRWRAGGHTGRRRPDVALAVPNAGGLTLRSGTHRLRLGYVRCPVGPRVTVRRFKTEEGATPTRVPERGDPGVCV